MPPISSSTAATSRGLCPENRQRKHRRRRHDLFHTRRQRSADDVDRCRRADSADLPAPVPLAASVRVRSRILNGANWSALNDAFFVVDATPASSANVVVSQVHYHPTDASATEIAAGFTNQDDFEFLELMNISAGRVDLSGVTFAAGTGLCVRRRRGDPGNRSRRPGAHREAARSI